LIKWIWLANTIIYLACTIIYARMAVEFKRGWAIVVAFGFQIATCLSAAVAVMGFLGGF
jgi:hypothetical protein